MDVRVSISIISNALFWWDSLFQQWNKATQKTLLDQIFSSNLISNS